MGLWYGTALHNLVDLVNTAPSRHAPIQRGWDPCPYTLQVPGSPQPINTDEYQATLKLLTRLATLFCSQVHPIVI